MSARTPLWVALSLIGLGALCACKPNPVSMTLNFPSVETFLQSEIGQVRAFDVTSADLGVCPHLLNTTVGGNPDAHPSLDSGPRPVCAFSSGFTFDDVPEGPKAYVVVASNAENTPMVAGCTIAEVYESEPPITINLFVTEQYRSAARTDLTCMNETDKCDRGCR